MKDQQHQQITYLETSVRAQLLIYLQIDGKVPSTLDSGEQNPQISEKMRSDHLKDERISEEPQHPLYAAWGCGPGKNAKRVNSK